MRKVIYKRLYQLFVENGNFKFGFRFKNAEFRGLKLSEIPYDDYTRMDTLFTDVELRDLFEFICYRYYKQG